MSTSTEHFRCYDQWGLVALDLAHEDDGAVRFTITDGNISRSVVISREQVNYIRGWVQR